MYIYIYICVYTHICIHIYIYIYIERERYINMTSANVVSVAPKRSCTRVAHITARCNITNYWIIMCVLCVYCLLCNLCSYYCVA